MAVKLSNASSTDSLLANDEFEMEIDQQHTSESPNHYDKDDTHNSVPVTMSQRTKPRFSIPSIHWTRERFMIVVMSVAILSLAAVIIALSVYVGELNHRVYTLETQSSTSVLNKTQLNSGLELEGGEISHLNEEFEKLKDRISVFENSLTRFNSSLSNSLLFFTNVDETASNNISALQRSVGLLEGDLGITKTQLQNLSLMYLNLLSNYDATVHDMYTTRAAIEQNMSQLHDLIQEVESNHSTILIELFRILGEAAENRSVLTHRINDTSNLVALQGQIISGIKSNVAAVQNDVTGLRGTLTTNVNSLKDRIDDHKDWIEYSLDGQSRKLTNLDDRISVVERKLASDAVHVVSLGFLLLSAIALLVCYIMFN